MIKIKKEYKKSMEEKILKDGKEKSYPTRNKKGKGKKSDNGFHNNPYKN